MNLKLQNEKLNFWQSIWFWVSPFTFRVLHVWMERDEWRLSLSHPFSQTITSNPLKLRNFISDCSTFAWKQSSSDSTAKRLEPTAPISFWTHKHFRFSMATFNMNDFNEILEKCKDQSQQQKQDQVRIGCWLTRHHSMASTGDVKTRWTMIFHSIFRHCCNLLYTFNRFLESKFGRSSDSPSISGSTSRSRSSLPSAKSFKCCTTRVFCKSRQSLCLLFDFCSLQ